MDDALLGIVIDRLDQRELADEPTDLLLAALDGDDALARQLGAAPGQRFSPAKTETSARNPVGAYLSSITVQGFRGIGPASVLKVKEGPGLTLVVGRNGSGKSSFAESLEVLLTGSLMRLKAAPLVVREGWRCKHTATEARVTAELYVEGKGRAVAVRSWLAGTGTNIENSSAWVQVRGEKQAPLQTLGWDSHLTEYRPFLSHAELEAFFGRPSELHDLLASVLGLEDLKAADTRLHSQAKLREDRLSDAKRELEPLRARLATLAEHDERAKACAKALVGPGHQKWDIDAAIAIATGNRNQTGDEGHIARLRRFANLTPPSAADVAEAVTALREAAASSAEFAGSAAGRARDLASLLDAALGHHAAHGDGHCPVCGNPGALNESWRTATGRHRDRLHHEARTADEAVSLAQTATTRARDLIQPLPPSLNSLTAEDPAAAAGAAEAWRQWAAAPENTTAPTPDSLTVLADYLEAACGPLAAAVNALTEQATADLASRDEQWSLLAADVATWCGAAASARSEAWRTTALKAARHWLTQATAELRDQRLAPLADQSRDIWTDLRQESNVSLGEFRLTGTSTRRQLDLDVTIDGVPGAALGVMSQGEINALALSIFLPRATMTDSPFRFLLIDDPVQAMDPAKVDGLAKVLGRVARDRQVIVFTHDNRLTAAVKDLSIPATIVEVTRQPGSNVAVRECLDASSQAIKDALSLTKDPGIPRPVAERVIPGLCRTAAEAAFTEAYWRAELRRGRTRAQIEESLEGNGKRPNLRATAAFALFGNLGEASKVAGQLSQWSLVYAGTYRDLNRGAHLGHPGSLPGLIAETESLIREITSRLP